MGERYKMVPNEVRQLVKGMYGKTTVPIKKEIVDKILEGEEQITCRPADLIKPELEQARKDCAVYMQQEEDVLTQAFFPKVAQNFFKKRVERMYKLDLDLLNEEDSVYPV